MRSKHHAAGHAVHEPYTATVSSDGNETIVVTAADAAGNTATKSYSWFVDSIPPAVSTPVITVISCDPDMWTATYTNLGRQPGLVLVRLRRLHVQLQPDQLHQQLHRIARDVLGHRDRHRRQRHHAVGHGQRQLRPAVMSTDGTTIGQYRIVGKIGEGGMGAVYLAQHTLLGRNAAIKLCCQRCRRSATSSSGSSTRRARRRPMTDPGIVSVFDFGYHTDGSAYIVMELLEGESLEARVDRGPMPVVEAVRIMRQA